jgi:hypothetical protein
MGWSGRPTRERRRAVLFRRLLANLMLANLMLDVLDKELEARCHRFVRGACPRAGRRPDPWADDCNIYVQSRIYVQSGGRGSGLWRASTSPGEAEPRRRIGPQALARFASRVRALTRRTAGVSLEPAIDRLSIYLPGYPPGYLTGWRGCFGFCQTPELLRNLEGWVRRRLRCLAWVQWRTGRRTLHHAAPTRDRPVARRHHQGGCAPARPLAAQSAPRPASRSIQRLPRRRRASHPGAGRRMTPPPTAVYGPVCTVVGRGGAARLPPIPIEPRYTSCRFP